MPWNNWLVVVRLVRSLDTRGYSGRFEYTDSQIVLTLLWAVLHRKPVCWACRAEAWPVFARAEPRPSPARMSRRLRLEPVVGLLRRVEEALRGDTTGVLVSALDGKCLCVSAHSGDRTATFSGRGLRGYKLHALSDLRGRVLAWRVTPMHPHEARVARRLLSQTPLNGYVLADANYDTVALYSLCASRGVQMLAPRQASRIGGGVRRHGTHPARQHAIDMVECGRSGFGPQLLRQRGVIERVFARLEHDHGVGRPPPWVRGIDRVRRWMSAVIILDLAALRARKAQTAA